MYRIEFINSETNETMIRADLGCICKEGLEKVFEGILSQIELAKEQGTIKDCTTKD